MSDTAASCVALLLVSAAVIAEVYLGWTFIRDWRLGRTEARARRYSLRRSVAGGASASAERLRLLACAGLAAAGMTAGVAAAEEPVAPPAEGAPATQVGQQPDSTAADATPQAAAAGPSDALGSAISLQLNLDFTNAYFYRGIRQQDKGLIVQPAARLTTRLVDSEEFKFDGFIGTWNSFGPNSGANTSDLTEDWYESDLYAGLTLTRDKLSLTASYTFLTSPSDAFETVQELGFTLALDDSEWMKAWALKPYATLAVETGSNGSDGADLDNGVYLELGIAPGLSFDVGETPITLTFPASVGLSLSDYYQDASGDDDAFGFAQVGAKASIPLGKPGRFGAWTLNAGVSVLFLGDHTKDLNDGDDPEVIGTIGLQWNF